MSDKTERSAPGSAPTGSAAPRQTLALAAMMFAVSMTFIDQTIVAIAAPSIVDELDLSSSGMQWVVNAYLLALAAFFALGGRLADIVGHRRIMVVGTLLFVVSSVLCGCVPDDDVALAWLITFRATQGLGAALMFPAALAVVVAVFPVDRRGRALALFFGLSGALTALGPLLGGWLTDWTWRAIFWVNVPVALVALVLTALAHIPPQSRRERLDVPGAALVAVGMGVSVLGLQQASAWGWSSVATWACIIGGLAVLGVFCAYELRVEQPLIKLAVFRDQAFGVDAAVLFFSMLAFVPVFFFASVYAQVSLSASPNQAALFLLYFFIGFGIASQWGGRILDQRGARPALKLGTALGAVGFALWANKLTDLSMHDQWLYAALAGAGIGFLLAPASTDAVNRSLNASYGEVTGITQTVRNYAAAVGLAVFGTILTHVTTDKVTETLMAKGVPDDGAREAARDIAEAVTGHPDSRTPSGEGPLATAMRDSMDAIRMDFAEANQWVFYGMAIALGIGFLCALRHPGTQVTEEQRTPGREPAHQ
ncbi:MFS transporter [Streptomyces neyagawaensis]|uniref:MFS transporter n=1 Tax=Streptomyces neyagawaensis TaxID=42238 RepID=UPI0006E3079A|nr:MFS transporter [Streptomyces neyagawaensis]MCL6739213.1 MFS transporter [Streptomyces neyagawaensis]MDE1688775.1 MFS transporter [Streptomyces neyagawaensis]